MEKMKRLYQGWDLDCDSPITGLHQTVSPIKSAITVARRRKAWVHRRAGTTGESTPTRYVIRAFELTHLYDEEYIKKEGGK
jgi:hypothetical protein